MFAKLQGLPAAQVLGSAGMLCATLILSHRPGAIGSLQGPAKSHRSVAASRRPCQS